MRIFVASMVGWLVLISLVFPTVVALAEIVDSQMHQNKNENIITITQGAMEVVNNSGRSKLSSEIIGVKTIKEEEAAKKNARRLAHYEPRLTRYSPPQGEISILVTGYSSTPDQTWGDPFTTASGTRVHIGTMACPPQYPFGAKVKIEKMGTFVCEDRGGMIKGNHFDMWFESRIKALNWGKRIVIAEIVK